MGSSIGHFLRGAQCGKIKQFAGADERDAHVALFSLSFRFRPRSAVRRDCAAGASLKFYDPHVQARAGCCSAKVFVVSMSSPTWPSVGDDVFGPKVGRAIQPCCTAGWGTAARDPAVTRHKPNPGPVKRDNQPHGQAARGGRVPVPSHPERALHPPHGLRRGAPAARRVPCLYPAGRRREGPCATRVRGSTPDQCWSSSSNRGPTAA